VSLTAFPKKPTLPRIYHRERGPVAWFLMDTARGTFRGDTGDVADITGNVSAGTRHGGCTWTSGQFGNALSFNGSTGYVTSPDTAAIHSDTVSLSAWFCLSATPSFAAVICKPASGPPWSSPYMTWLIRINDSTSIEYDISNGSSYSGGSPPTGVFTVPTLVSGAWNHVALTYDGTTLIGYFNGKQVGAVTNVTGPLVYTSTPIMLGADYGSSPFGDPFPGVIDNVAIFGYPISAVQVYRLYTNPFWRLRPGKQRSAVLAGTATPPPTFLPGWIAPSSTLGIGVY